MFRHLFMQESLIIEVLEVETYSILTLGSGQGSREDATLLRASTPEVFTPGMHMI